jgi:hypothetical protein
MPVPTISKPSASILNSNPKARYVARMLEFDVDPQGNTHSKNWEWK